MNKPHPSRPVEILLVEDDPGDVRLTLEAIKNVQIPAHVNVAQDGFEAVDTLCRQGRFEAAATPDLILLDLNMPRMDGRECLAQIKSNSSFQHIPVVVLTTSARAEDVDQSYRLHANAYITKPVEIERLNEVVKAIHQFWFTTATLPRSAEV